MHSFIVLKFFSSFDEYSIYDKSQNFCVQYHTENQQSNIRNNLKPKDFHFLKVSFFFYGKLRPKFHLKFTRNTRNLHYK